MPGRALSTQAVEAAGWVAVAAAGGRAGWVGAAGSEEAAVAGPTSNASEV